MVSEQKWTVTVHSQEGARGVEKGEKQMITLGSLHREDKSP